MKCREKDEDWEDAHNFEPYGELKEENARLKELLKEWVKAYPVVAVTCDLKNFVKIKELLDKTNEVSNDK